jgi:hypothetical protein
MRIVLAVPKHFGGISNLGLPSAKGEEDTGRDSRNRNKISLLVAGREIEA